MEIVRTNGSEHWNKSESVGTYAELWVARCMIEHFGGPASCEGYVGCTKVGNDLVFKHGGDTWTIEAKWDAIQGGDSKNIAIELDEEKPSGKVAAGIKACTANWWAHVTPRATYLFPAGRLRDAVVGKYPVAIGGVPKRMHLALVPIRDAEAWPFVTILPGVDIAALAKSNPNPIAAVRNYQHAKPAPHAGST